MTASKKRTFLKEYVEYGLTLKVDKDGTQCALCLKIPTGLIMSEKITKYFEDKLKNKDSTIEKLRLKNSSMRSKLHKIRSQLKQKEEMGEILHQVDFDQLRIEYEQDMERIMELYEQLMKLKLESG